MRTRIRGAGNPILVALLEDMAQNPAPAPTAAFCDASCRSCKSSFNASKTDLHLFTLLWATVGNHRF